MTVNKAIRIAKMQGDRILTQDPEAQEALLMLILCAESVQEVLEENENDLKLRAPEYWDAWYKVLKIVGKHVGKLDDDCDFGQKRKLVPYNN